MRYAVFSDVHANLEALEAVLATCERLKIDRFLCLGDMIGYNADPVACMTRIKSLPDLSVVKGNHDEHAGSDRPVTDFSSNAKVAIEWTRKQLLESDKQWLDALPMHIQVENITIVHATLDSPEEWGYIVDKFSAEANFYYQRSQLCFCGHSHRPLAFEKFGGIRQLDHRSEIIIEAGHKYLINVGSVGQPRDGDCRSAFLSYDTDQQRAVLHRVPYNIKEAQRKIRRAGLPIGLAQRLEKGL